MSEANVTPVRYLLRSPMDIETEREYYHPDWSEEHYLQYARLQEELRFQQEQYKKLEATSNEEKARLEKRCNDLVDRCREYMDSSDNSNARRRKLEDELEAFKFKADREKQDLIRKLHKCEERINQQEQENAELERQVRDLRDPIEDQNLKAEIEHYKNLLAEAEHQKEEEKEAKRQVSNMFHEAMLKDGAVRRALKMQVEQNIELRRRLKEPQIEDPDEYIRRVLDNLLNPIPLDERH